MASCPFAFKYFTVAYHLLETAWQSTTSDKNVAIQYTGISENRKYPTLLEIQPAAVDHGADISKYSQFAGEKEYLWNPCSLVEGQDDESIEATKEGIINKISVRMNNNVKTQTVEELRQLKKSLHLNAFQYIRNEIESDLSALAQARFVNSQAEEDISVAKAGVSYSAIRKLIERILKDCETRYTKHLNKNPDEFIQDETYRGLVREMVETKAMAISKLRLWLEDTSQQWTKVLKMPLRTAHRTLIGFLESGIADAKEEIMQASYELCKMKNLITVSVDELNDLQEPVIIQASAEGADVGTLKLLVAAGADVNSKDSMDWTAVMKASFAGHTQTVEALVTLRADVNAKNSEGDTAVMLAAQNGHYDTLKVLMKHGNFDAKTLEVNKNNFSALSKAARSGHSKIVEFIVEKIKQSDETSRVNTAQGGCSRLSSRWSHAIMMAAQGGHTQLVKYLAEECDQPFDYNERDVTGKTVLFHAAEGGHTETIQSIFNCKAIIHDYDREKMTPMMRPMVKQQLSPCYKFFIFPNL